MALHPGTIGYLLEAAAATPLLLERLCLGHAPHDPCWDARPDPERFTPREVVAHLADWEEVFLGRLRQTAEEDSPILVNRDEGTLAIERGYGTSNPHANAGRFAEGRARLLDYLHRVPSSAWARVGVHEHYGPMTLETQLVQIVAHDGNHIKQLLGSL